MGKRLLAALCTAMLFMTTPGVAVLANESINDESITEQVDEITDVTEQEDSTFDVSVSERDILDVLELEEVIGAKSYF